jgi:hypothetical protein
VKKLFILAILAGWLLLGSVAPASAAAGDVPPRPLTEQGLTNLTALTRLIGYVRFFHPSDQVAGLTNADWDALAMAGVEQVEAARNPGELAAALSTLFDGIAPTVRVLPFSPSAQSAVQLPKDTDHGRAVRWLAWRHEGADLHTGTITSYESERVEVGRVPDGASASVAQDLDVERLRGHRVRLSAAVRFTAGAAGGAALNLHASTASGSGPTAWSQPIPSIIGSGWRRVEIDAQVPGDAIMLTLSFDLTGSGRLTFDDVRATADGLDVTGQLINSGLEEVVPGLPPRGWLLSHTPFGAEYSLRPITDAAAGHWAAELASQVRPVGLPLVADLGGGVSALVPMTLPANDQGTFPQPPLPPVPPVPDKPAGFVPSGLDRTTRLAGAVVGWGVPQHFYPYFERVGADWPGALRRALTSAAVDPDEASYLRTLRRLVVELEDGHARVLPVTLPVRFAFTWDWIENQLVITSVEQGATHGMTAGDRILTIDGRPVAAALAEIESLTSAATPQWRLYRALLELSAGLPGGTATLTVQPHTGGPVRTVTAAYTAPVGSTVGVGGFGSPVEPRPEQIAQVRPGIFYVDLSRISDDDFNAAADQLAAADGVVFDMRGYPWLGPEAAFKHLIDKPVTSNWFNIPIVTRPDRQGWDWRPIYWFWTPLAPRLTGRIAFLINGQDLSYAESLMGIVEAEHLGALVGGPTGGTNGGIDPVPVAGGYTLRFTGMDVRKKDGSPHHGVGIKPTVPVSRTLAGVIAGRDELLEKGIEVVSHP